jgi:transposase
MKQPKGIYSMDLRLRVIGAIDSGMPRKDAAKIFKIGFRTINRWIALRKTTGNLEPKKDWEKGHSHAIRDLEKFKKFVEQNCYLTLEEMANKWGNISRSTVAIYIKKN